MCNACGQDPCVGAKDKHEDEEKAEAPSLAPASTDQRMNMKRSLDRVAVDVATPPSTRSTQTSGECSLGSASTDDPPPELCEKVKLFKRAVTTTDHDLDKKIEWFRKLHDELRREPIELFNDPRIALLSDQLSDDQDFWSANNCRLYGTGLVGLEDDGWNHYDFLLHRCEVLIEWLSATDEEAGAYENDRDLVVPILGELLADMYLAIQINGSTQPAQPESCNTANCGNSLFFFEVLDDGIMIFLPTISFSIH